MRLPTGITRCSRKPVIPSLLLGCLLALASTQGFCSSSSPESIQATYGQDGNAVNVTLVIYNYTTSSAMQILSQAFEEGQDRGLVTALSKTKANGVCTIAGGIGFNVAFIQMLVTSTGRRITFITNRPLPSSEVSPDPESESFDLVVGQFDMNDTDETKSTGFLFPASRLVADGRGEFHYDLAGHPWPLVNVLDPNWAPAVAGRGTPDAIEGSSIAGLTP